MTAKYKSVIYSMIQSSELSSRFRNLLEFVNVTDKCELAILYKQGAIATSETCTIKSEINSGYYRDTETRIPRSRFHILRICAIDKRQDSALPRLIGGRLS